MKILKRREKNYNREIKRYWTQKKNLFCQNGIVIRQDRILILGNLRKGMIEKNTQRSPRYERMSLKNHD